MPLGGSFAPSAPRRRDCTLRGAARATTILVALASSGCGRSDARPAPTATATATATVTATATASATAVSSATASAASDDDPGAEPRARGRGDKSGGGKGGGRRFDEAAVHLDGRVVGVLKHAELPPTLSPKMVERGGEPYPVFPLAEYLEELGANLGRVREVHLAGGRRTAILAGAELRRVRDKLHFDFTRATAGKPRMAWPNERVESGTQIDMIQGVQIYQEKKPPRYEAATRRLVFEDGTPVEGVAYADPADGVQGTRVYVDGRFVRALARRALPEALARGRDRYALDGFLEQLGVRTARLRAIDFVSDDRVVGRLRAQDYLALKRTLEFSVPPESRGRMHVDLDARATHAPGRVEVTALAIFVGRAPPERTVEAPKRRPE
jgi:hypothetical protein